MEVLTNLTYRHSLSPSLHHRRPSISSPFSPFSFKPPPSSSPFKLSIKASSSASFSLSRFLLPNPKTPKSQPFKTLIPPPIPILKTTLIAAVTAAALFFANHRPLLAAPISPPPTVESTTDAAEEEKGREFKDHINSNHNDVESLRKLMELRIKERKIPEAIDIIEKLIQIQPEDIEWRLLKCHMHFHNEELELAKLGFKQIISIDPLRVEAYHGLLMVASQSDSSTELGELDKKIKEGMEVAKEDKLRDFKLLYAQIRVIEGDYNESLNIYEELIKGNPNDFRPYLCKGIIYTLVREKDEADKCFQKYRDLVPKGHPYAKHFDEHMIATKLFLQKVENETKR